MLATSAPYIIIVVIRKNRYKARVDLPTDMFTPHGHLSPLRLKEIRKNQIPRFRYYFCHPRLRNRFGSILSRQLLRLRRRRHLRYAICDYYESPHRWQGNQEDYLQKIILCLFRHRILLEFVKFLCFC